MGKTHDSIRTTFTAPISLISLYSINPPADVTVNQLMVGGEALDKETINKVLTQGNPERLVNSYGPTEDTAFTTSYDDAPPHAPNDLLLTIQE